MNLIQRIVLVLGAVAVAFVTILTLRVVILDGKVAHAANVSDVLAPVIDVRTVGALGLAGLPCRVQSAQKEAFSARGVLKATQAVSST